MPCTRSDWEKYLPVHFDNLRRPPMPYPHLMLCSQTRDQARRFILLVDELYNHKTALVGARAAHSSL